MGGLSIWHWLIVLVVVIVIFGTKRLKNVGQDLGEAIKGFKKGMQDGEADDDKPSAQLGDESRRGDVGKPDLDKHAPDKRAEPVRKDDDRDPPAAG